ncbi:Hsp20/alpha crystallin family protein [Niallia nealsonii]|uniref:Heat-shock protein Hsp20 n=1 Tax=Niallia nealsonii TaxID=115979 RepID=A0A2N0YYR0_9BACI|nr:Hsp20/alpha crystallin family protein [Niallia nealsonii]PKG22393.1 heat-shock protein Hsp20 [Niallia nealsonii]
MNNKKDKQNWNGNMEDWLKDFFLDPLTTFLDEAEFRIDVFETENYYIIEALLPPCKKEDLNISAENDALTIMVNCLINRNIEKKQRTVSFPFSIDTKEIQAVLNREILEILISKQAVAKSKGKKSIIIK